MSTDLLTITSADLAEQSVTETGLANSRIIAILRLLLEYRFLTTGQCHTLLGQKWPQQTRRALARARKKRLIKSFAYQPGLGNRSELCWQLTLTGIHFLEKADGSQIGYNSSFWRKPPLERIQQRDSELELEQQVKGVGWKVIRPRTYNHHKPLPNTNRMTEPEYCRTNHHYSRNNLRD